MWIAALLLAVPTPQVDGLRPGESAVDGPRDAALGPRDCSRGRVLDGSTGAPVAGATIELWTEGWAHPPGPYASGTTLADGSFRIAHEGVQHVDKLLVRAAGYRSTTAPTSDAREIHLLRRTRSLGLRAVDLEGKPIVGAVAETRQTCAHAPPAYVGVSDEDGRFDLSAFPPLDDNPEVVVQARGHGAVFLGFADELLLPGGLEVRLPRRKPIAFRVVDTAGKPLAQRRVSLGGEPHWIASTTDSEGRAQFDSPFFGRTALLRIEHERGEASLLDGPVPSAFEPRLVLPRHYADTGADTGGAGSAPEYVAVEVVDREGRPIDTRVASIGLAASDLAAAPERALRADQGRTTLVAGGPFRGWNEVVVTLEHPERVKLVLEREPALEIALPDGHWTVHVQQGDDSVTLETTKGTLSVSVPAGGPLLVCAVGPEETRLARLERVERPGGIGADVKLDLTPASCVVARRPEPGPPSRVRVLAQVAEIGSQVGVQAAEIAAELRTGWGMVEAETRSGDLSFELAPATRFEGRFLAEGCVARAFGPGFESLGTGSELRVLLARRGSLVVRGGLRALYAAGDEGLELEEQGLIVEGLAPGPLVADLVRMDGSVVTVSLDLAPGERRTLELR